MGGEARFEVFGQRFAEGKALKFGLQVGGQGAQALETLVEFANDVEGVGIGAAISAGEEGAAVVVAMDEGAVELQEPFLARGEIMASCEQSVEDFLFEGARLIIGVSFQEGLGGISG